MDERIEALIRHFDDLHRAHESVLKARDQIQRLTPLVEDCDTHDRRTAQADAWRACREALAIYFAQLKLALIDERLEKLHRELARHDDRITSLTTELEQKRHEEQQLRQQIAENGGDRIAQLKHDIRQLEADRDRRREKAERYRALLTLLDRTPQRALKPFLISRRTWSVSSIVCCRNKPIMAIGCARWNLTFFAVNKSTKN